jgi:hypothetical protein
MNLFSWKIHTIVTAVNFSFLTIYQSFFSQKFFNNDGNWSKRKDLLYSFLNFFARFKFERSMSVFDRLIVFFL